MITNKANSKIKKEYLKLINVLKKEIYKKKDTIIMYNLYKNIITNNQLIIENITSNNSNDNNIHKNKNDLNSEYLLYINKLFDNSFKNINTNDFKLVDNVIYSVKTNNNFDNTELINTNNKETNDNNNAIANNNHQIIKNNIQNKKVIKIKKSLKPKVLKENEKKPKNQLGLYSFFNKEKTNDLSNSLKNDDIKNIENNNKSNMKNTIKFEKFQNEVKLNQNYLMHLKNYMINSKLSDIKKYNLTLPDIDNFNISNNAFNKKPDKNNVYNRRFIYIEESSTNAIKNEKIADIKKTSLSFKNPYKKDNIIVDYELDSEDEINDYYAEDLNSEKSKCNKITGADNSEDEDEEEEDEYNDDDNNKWIVDDCYISDEDNCFARANINNIDSSIKEKNININTNNNEDKTLHPNESKLNKLLDVRANYQKPIVINFKEYQQSLINYNINNIDNQEAFLNKQNINVNLLNNSAINDDKINLLSLVFKAKIFNLNMYKLDMNNNNNNVLNRNDNDYVFPLSNTNKNTNNISLDEINEHVNDIVNIVHYSFENSKEILKEIIYNQFKIKKKELDVFFNNNVYKTLCDKTKQVS